MRILVTGSAGLIGSSLVKRLEDDGHDVVGWDISNGQDVREMNQLDGDLDALFHLACPVDPADYEGVALNTITTSVTGTQNMLEIAKTHSAKFLYISSSEIYGELKDESFNEDALSIIDPSGMRTYYDSSKLMGEVMTMIYHRYHGLDVRIIRPFNIYGPGMRKNDSRVIPSFIRKIKSGQPIQINGDGGATRTFCYIDDFIEGIVRAMFYDNTNGQVFNLGTNEVTSVKELADMLLVYDLYNDTQIEYVSARQGEQHTRRPDIAKAQKYLDWEPFISLREGLGLTWENYP